MKLKPRLSLLVLLISAMLTAGCGSVPGASSPPAEEELIPVNVGMLYYSSYLPLYIAQAEGFYTEQGLDVEFIQFTNGADALLAMIQGEIDVSGNTLELGTLTAIQEGVNLRYVADKGYLEPAACPSIGWVVRNEVIESGQMDDLNNLVNLNFGMTQGTSIMDYAMDAMLAPASLNSADLNYTSEIPTPSRGEALANGAVDVVNLSEPWITRVVNSGVAQVWNRWEDYLPGAQLAVIWYGPTFIEQNREAGERFMLAYLQGVRQYSQGKTDRNVELMAEMTGLELDEARAACWLTINPEGGINPQTVLDLQEWAIGRGFFDGPIIAVDGFWDDAFVEAADVALSGD